MTIESTHHENVLVLTVHGRMDAENAHEFEQQCRQWVAAGNTRLIADVSGLSYISSMGLRAVLSVAQDLRAQGGSLALCGIQGLVRQVFEMTKLLDLFPQYKTVDEALHNA